MWLPQSTPTLQGFGILNLIFKQHEVGLNCFLNVNHQIQQTKTWSNIKLFNILRSGKSYLNKDKSWSAAINRHIYFQFRPITLSNIFSFSYTWIYEYKIYFWHILIFLLRNFRPRFKHSFYAKCNSTCRKNVHNFY